jgi:hypothetical protein
VARESWVWRGRVHVFVCECHVSFNGSAIFLIMLCVGFFRRELLIACLKSLFRGHFFISFGPLFPPVPSKICILCVCGGVGRVRVFMCEYRIMLSHHFVVLSFQVGGRVN